MQFMVLAILGLKASVNVAFWIYGKKKRRNLYLLSKFGYQNKSFYLLSYLGYQKKSLYLFKTLCLRKSSYFLNKNFILLLSHFDFLFFNLNKIYSLDALFFVFGNPRKRQFNNFFICIIMKHFEVIIVIQPCIGSFHW
ncbi:uncharacterized protein RHIMIDRAFT_75977 [Rhizopus microsporus ATCC 52813]|uniref:Uncharacterized protein n=1 Tax=Rhizopus microsporus ATCC 52813 TaxID=1340429 RepID=A0A2G4SI22_RHIZD|nr:uncharacterized protein RHIMIDRAFT_75977 [Rhizopus microsporus ATCC 52813]PHZ08428.1 hypothetical protein RHIMIDRAFT_75977 [Rhizopus microsporus ATCC 52813]